MSDNEDLNTNNESSEVDKQDDSDMTLKHRKIMDCAKETFESASRMLRRKIPCTGHLMTPRRLWIQTIPTHECDVVLMFPSGAQDFTLMWLLSRLRAGTPGLVVHVRHHSSSDSYGFYLTAPFNVLMKAAEELHLPKTLRAEYGGGLKEFVQAEVDYFEGTDDQDHFFTTQERQWLVLHLLQTLRATQGDTVAGLKLIEGQAIVPKCVAAGVISQVFPLHDQPALHKLRKTWVRSFTRTQPLDSISTYFGVKIAMYFAWLGHYTTALIVPAIVGFTFWVGFGRGDQATEDVGFVLFSFFNVLWFSVYLEAWKRYCAELAYRWGTLDQRDELLQEPRPLFTCAGLRLSDVRNMEKEDFLGEWKCLKDTGNIITENKEQEIDLTAEGSHENYSDQINCTSIAEQLNGSVLRENEDLRQELFEEKNKSSFYVLELEDKLKEKEDIIESQNKIFEEKENTLLNKIKFLDQKLKKEKEAKEILILQIEEETKANTKNNEIEYGKCNRCTIYEEENARMLVSIRSLEEVIKIMEKDNLDEQNELSHIDLTNSACLHCFPTLNKNKNTQEAVSVPNKWQVVRTPFGHKPQMLNNVNKKVTEPDFTSKNIYEILQNCTTADKTDEMECNVDKIAKSSCSVKLRFPSSATGLAPCYVIKAQCATSLVEAHLNTAQRKCVFLGFVILRSVTRELNSLLV
ncbi:Anoctamin-8 [Homalodisca vitripennis]|nr:Anoctamin-8 [Homalodisca vitripennis]